MPSKHNLRLHMHSNVYAQPIVIDRTVSPVITNNVVTEYIFADNNKEFKSIVELLKDHENLVIYNKANDRLYSLEDGEKNCIAINKTGITLTDDNFGKKNETFEH
jgi:hypothetical protein